MAIASEVSKTPLPDQAIDYTVAANPLIGIRDQDIFESVSKLFEQTAINPALAAKHCAAYLGELGRIAAGASQLAPDAKDKRFADPAWKDSVAYRRLAQNYLAWVGALTGFIDEATKSIRRQSPCACSIWPLRATPPPGCLPRPNRSLRRSTPPNSLGSWKAASSRACSPGCVPMI